MKKLIFALLLFACGAASGRGRGPVFTPADSPEIRFTGRAAKGPGGALSFDWSGSQFTFRFEGTRCAMRAADTGRNYYNVFVDGRHTGVAATSGADTTVVLAEGLERGPHTILVQKRTEGEQGRTTLRGVETDGALLPLPAPRTRHIEFIGDSHTDGFHDYAGLGNATYFTKNGLTVKDVVEKSFIELDGKKVTLAEALGTRQFGKVYILLGINEIGAYTAADWAAQYKSLLDLVREKQPDAVIFIQSIFHTTQKKSDSSYFKNEVINERNAAIAQLADGKTIFYLDLNPLFDDENGALRADYSGDGVHVRAPYYVQWRDHLYQFGVVK